MNYMRTTLAILLLATLLIGDRTTQGHDLSGPLASVFSPDMHTALHRQQLHALAANWLTVEAPAVQERLLVLVWAFVDPNGQEISRHTTSLNADAVTRPQGVGFGVEKSNGVMKPPKRIWCNAHWVDRQVRPADRVNLQEFAAIARQWN